MYIDNSIIHYIYILCVLHKTSQSVLFDLTSAKSSSSMSPGGTTSISNWKKVVTLSGNNMIREINISSNKHFKKMIKKSTGSKSKDSINMKTSPLDLWTFKMYILTPSLLA